MSTEDHQTQIPTLNPMFLQAARDEAAKRKMAEEIRQQPSKQIHDFAIEEIESSENFYLSTKDETVEHIRKAEPTITSIQKEEGIFDVQEEGLAKRKAAISSKQAEIERTQQQINRLLKIKNVVASNEPAIGKANLNELRMKRLAIQMALVADSKEYDDGDLQAVDNKIAELTANADNRHPILPSNSAESLRLNAKADELQDTLQSLKDELNELIYSHNVRVAFRKAKQYIQSLKEASMIRHELLALAELLANDDILTDMKLGGELPIPTGFEPFDAIFLDTLETSLEGIEEAKARIKSEIVP